MATKRNLHDADLQAFIIECGKLAQALKDARAAAGMMAAILSDARFPAEHPLHGIVERFQKHLCNERFVSVAGIIRAIGEG